MLHLLNDYARKHGLEPEPGFTQKNVRWAIVCKEDGRFDEVIEIGQVGSKNNPGQTFEKCPEFSFSEMKAGGVTKSHFLVDTAEVVALYGKGADDPKIQAKHKYFVELLHKASTVMPALAGLARQLDNPDTVRAIAERMAANKIRPVDRVTFRVGDSYPVESNVWHKWWQELRKQLAGKESDLSMRSLATGHPVVPVSVHPKVKGLAGVGGIATGDALVSFKQDSFRSYGLSQSANAAVSEEEAKTYAEALNVLIRDHGRVLAGAKVVHWFKKKIEPEYDPLPWLEKGGEIEELSAQRRARELLESIRSGKQPDLSDNYYYALTLSGAAGRVMVRDWMEGQFEELVENIGSWFNDLEIVNRDGAGLASPPKFLAVLGATVRNLDDLPPPFVARMWRVAVRAEAIPRTALAQALARTRVDIIGDQPLNHAGMGLMKAYHVRKERLTGKENIMKPNLNESHPHPAYHCGRLLAVLAQLQRTALGDVGAGVVQRYYAAASATPALVLGRLAVASQHHLNKLDSPGLIHWYEEKIAGIWGQIKDHVPATLDLEEQSLFALGYYHQMADMRTKKPENNTEEKEKNNG